MTGADSDEPLPGDGVHQKFAFKHSSGLADLLSQLKCSLLVTTYQAGKLVVVRPQQDRLSMLVRTFDRAMGLAVEDDRIAIATRWQIWTLVNARDLAPKLPPQNTYDACFMPRTAHVTGGIDVHEIGWARDELWIVNTMYACLCTLESPYSFVPRWRPSFVSRLIRQDRCHLNGLALDQDGPRYVTAFAETDALEGWRPHKVGGGVIIDVKSSNVVARGFIMPHSPRLHEGQLYVLDSGRGRLVRVDPNTGELETVAELAGYTRGLAFHGRWAFVGLSKIRETATFGGVPVAERPGGPMCGVAVVDLQTGRLTEWLEFQGVIAEVFDVKILPGAMFPAVIGLEKGLLQKTCYIGPERPPGVA